MSWLVRLNATLSLKGILFIVLKLLGGLVCIGASAFETAAGRPD